MTYQRFEDLPVWQQAARLYESVDDFLEDAPRRLRPSVRDQLERAVLSVSNNIAEGFERGTTNELLAFIYIARGSADSLQNSDIKGQRHLNRRTREREEQTQRAKSLQKDLVRKLPSTHPLRRDAEA